MVALHVQRVVVISGLDRIPLQPVMEQLLTATAGILIVIMLYMIGSPAAFQSMSLVSGVAVTDMKGMCIRYPVRC